MSLWLFTLGNRSSFFVDSSCRYCNSWRLRIYHVKWGRACSVFHLFTIRSPVFLRFPAILARNRSQDKLFYRSIARLVEVLEMGVTGKDRIDRVWIEISQKAHSVLCRNRLALFFGSVVFSYVFDIERYKIIKI